MPNLKNSLISAKNWFISIPLGIWAELLIRCFLLSVFLVLELAPVPPFQRIIQPEEAWLYKFPTTSNAIVSSRALSVSEFVIHLFTPNLMMASCLAVILIAYGINRKLVPGFVALLVPTLAIPLTGIITNVVKITVGRPRPDYFNRCYGESYLTILDLKQKCTGDTRKVQDGRKSFPSGHSSLSFCALGFISVYLGSQLKTFVVKGSSWRLLLTFLPLGAATMVAISRTVDYHHHWQDVVVGSILGFGVMYTAYRQYFPALTSPNCQIPYDLWSRPGQGQGQEYDSLEMSMASTSSGNSGGGPTTSHSTSPNNQATSMSTSHV